MSGADLARAWYCVSWFVESRNHSALISPVTMNEYARSCFHLSLFRVNTRGGGTWVLTPSTCQSTVVSRVLGNALRKICARSGSLKCGKRSSITFSAAGELNLRQLGWGRW